MNTEQKLAVLQARRQFLQTSGMGIGAAALGALLPQNASAHIHHEAKAKHVIFLFMAGAPRGIAIINGTIAAAVGLGMQMWLAGIVLGLIGHAAAVYAAKKDPKFLEVGVRHLKHGPYLSC